MDKDEVIAAFSLFDRDNTGKVSAKELLDMLVSFMRAVYSKTKYSFLQISPRPTAGPSSNLSAIFLTLLFSQTTFGDAFSEEEADAFRKDAGGKDKIDYEDFVERMAKLAGSMYDTDDE